MATTEQFSLRWNNFHSNITSGFHELLQANDMVDVTLSVEGQFLQAHKVVLSICSPFFKQIFKTNPCKHPVIVLRDVTYGNLKDILEFMYLGEVNVLRDNLSAFLRTAELLQVKGLTGDDSSETSSRRDDRSDSACENDFDNDLQQLIEPKSPSLMPLPLTSTPMPIINMKRPKNEINKNKRVKSDVKGSSNIKIVDEDFTEIVEPKNENVDDSLAAATNNNEIIKQLLENNLSGNDSTIQEVINFGQEWEVGHIFTKTSYRAGTGAQINASVGLKIGLRGINVTLKSEPSKDSPLAKEIIDYNERFEWTWDQGRFGFGPEAGLLQREFRAAQYRGSPTPILWVVDHFVIDGEGFRFGRFYRTAGWYTHILIWTAFPCWLLSLILFRSVIRYGAYFLGITGSLLLFGNIIWSLIRNPNKLVIPFEDAAITVKFGFSFWLCLFTGLLCVILSAVIVFLEANFDTAVSIFFGIDPLRSFDEYILTRKELELLRDKSGFKQKDILAMTELQPSSSSTADPPDEPEPLQTVLLKRSTTMRIVGPKQRIRRILPPPKDDEQPLYGNMSTIQRHEKKPVLPPKA